jgi:hypothetical protein
MLCDHKEVKNCKYTLVRKRLYFDLQPFEINTCCKFLGPKTPRIYVNMSTLPVAVFRTQVVKGKHFFVAITTGVILLREESDSDITIVVVH